MKMGASPNNNNSNNTITCLKFNLKIVSAENLPNVRSRPLKTRAFAKVYITTSDQKIKGRTPSDTENALNPVWNHPMSYVVAESGVHYDGLNVVIKLYTQLCGSLGRRYIGEVHTSMKYLYDISTKAGDGETTSLSLPVTRGPDKTDGILRLSYSFGEKIPSVEKSDFIERLGIAVMLQVAMDLLFFAVYEISAA